METGSEELIISTDNFGNALKSTTCDPSLALEFINNEEYNIAVDKWEWVNFNANRTFIMLVDECPGKPGTNPWIVNNATYNEAGLTVNFNASQTSWESLTTLFTFDWGSDVTSKVLSRRAFGIDIPNPIDVS